MKRRVILLATNTLLVVLMAIGMVSQVQAQHSVPARHSMPAQHSMPAVALPAGWVDYEVNEIGGGSSLNSTGTLLVQGSGADIWGLSDSFHFTSRPAVVAADQLYAHVDSQTGTSPWAKAGVMIRASLSDATAPYAFLMATPGNGLALQYRTAGGVLSQNFVAGAAGSATYLKLSSAGTVVTAYTGSDGINWNQVGTPVTVALGTAPYIGMAVTSHSAGSYNLATFSKIGPDAFIAPVPVASVGTGAAVDLASTVYNPSAVVSASTTAAGSAPANAVDTDFATPATASYWANLSTDTAPWFQVDMGATYAFKSVSWTWSAVGASTTPAEPTIIGSVDGKAWYTISAFGAIDVTGAPIHVMTTGGSAAALAFARYVRLVEPTNISTSWKLVDFTVKGGLGSY